MKRVAVIGLGLLGASFGMSLRGAGYHRIGWARRDSIRKQALSLDIVDEVTIFLPGEFLGYRSLAVYGP